MNLADTITINIEKYTLEEKNCIVDGLSISYKLCDISCDADIWVSSTGKIYISENVPENFRNLIAFHEKIEYDWLIEQDLPAPRYNVKLKSRESEIAMEIHNQAHYLELKATNELGILDEYVKWRPHERDFKDDYDLTDMFYQKLKSVS